MEADELKEKQKAFKKAAKQIKGKDAKLKLEGITACSDNSFLVEGACLQPLLDILTPKKKNGAIIEAALRVLFDFLGDEPSDVAGDAQSTPNALFLFEQATQKKKKLKFSGSQFAALLEHPKEEVTIYAMKCFACLFACANATRTSEDTLLSKSYFDVLFGKSPAVSACLCKFLALTVRATTEGASGMSSEFISEAPVLKVKCLIIIRFLCGKYPTELEIVLRDAPETLVQCVESEDAAVLDHALPLMLSLCDGSTVCTIILRDACGQALINSLVKTLGNLANENKRRDVLIITAINVILKVLSSSTSETDPIDYLPCTPVLEKLIAFSLPSDGESASHAEACRLLSEIGDRSEDCRTEICRSGVLGSMLNLMNESTIAEGNSDDAMCHLRRAVEKALYSLCCSVSTVPTLPSHLGARPALSSCKEVDPKIVGAAITREGLIEGLGSSNRDARSRILRLVAKLVSAPANALKLGPTAIDPLVAMITAWSARRSVEGDCTRTNSDIVDKTAVGVDAEMVHCCECLVALAQADAKSCAAVGAAETIKGLISIFGAGPVTTEDFLASGSEPKCFVGCPLDWSWETLMPVEEPNALSEKCIRGVAASVLMAIAEGGSRWSVASTESDEIDMTPTQAAALSIAELASSTCLNILSVDVDFHGSTSFWGSFRQETLVEAQMKLDMLNLLRAIATMKGGTEKLLAAAQEQCPGKNTSWVPPGVFELHDFMHDGDAPSDADAYVWTLAGVVSLLFNPKTEDATLRSALRTVRALCWDQTLDLAHQDVTSDTLSSVAISMGVLVPLVSLQQAIGDSSSDSTLLSDIESLSVYLIERGRVREAYWKAEFEAGPEEQKSSDSGEFGELDDCAAAASPASEQVAGDPNQGPTQDQWTCILDSQVDDIRNSQKKSTALLAAQIGGSESIVEALLRAGASANIADGAGITPIMYALRQGNEGGVTEVLKNGGDVDAVDADGNSVLKLGFLAPFREQVNALMLHLDSAMRGVDGGDETSAAVGVHGRRNLISCDGTVADHASSSSGFAIVGNARFLRGLLQAGADPNVSDDEGNFPLHWALSGTSVAFHIRGRTVEFSAPALLAIGENQESAPVYSLLLSFGALIDVCNKEGNTPLHIAVRSGYTEAAHHLLDAGADPNMKNKNGRLALHLGCFVALDESANLVNRLVLVGNGHPFIQGVFADDRKGKRKVDKQVFSVSEVLANVLAEAACPTLITTRPASLPMIVLEPDSFGVSALEYACGARAGDISGIPRASHAGTLEALLAFDGVLEATLTMGTLLQITATASNIDGLALLIRTASMPIDLSVLHAACSVQEPGCAALLLEHIGSAAIVQPGASGESAIEVAIIANSPKVVALLIERLEDSAALTTMTCADGRSVLQLAKDANLVHFKSSDFSDPLNFTKGPGLIASDEIVLALVNALSADAQVQEDKHLVSSRHIAAVAVARHKADEDSAATLLQSVVRQRAAQEEVQKKKRRAQPKKGKKK